MDPQKSKPVTAADHARSNFKSTLTREQAPWYLSKGYPLLWLAIAGFLLFARTIAFDYTYLDDQTLILNNLNKLSQASFIKQAFTEDVFHAGPGRGYYYRPLLTLTFMADAALGGGKFGMFHFSNIIYHILATFLLFLFFCGTGSDRRRSFLFSLLFLVHPMVTQAVSWVPGRNDSLLAIVVLGGFITFLKYLKTGSSRYLVIHFLLYIAALLTKENAVVLPVLIMVYGVTILRTPLKKFPLPAIVWLIITMIWAAVRYQALTGGSQLGFSTQMLSAIQNFPAVLPFLGKMLFPLQLSVFPILADMKISSILGFVVVAILAVIVMLTKPKQWFICIFGILWFLAFLVPSFVSFNHQINNFSEHRSYLSLAGILFLVMACFPVRNSDFSKPLPLLVMGAFILAASVITFLHSASFRNNFTFWENAVETSPSNAFNYNNLGAMYYLAGNLGKAEPLFRKAIEINPVEPMANGNIGLVCMNSNRPEEAEKYYLEEIRINPNYDNAYYNLGLLFYKKSRIDDAITLWEKTISISPYYVDAYKALAQTYQQLNRSDDYNRIIGLARQMGLTN